MDRRLPALVILITFSVSIASLSPVHANYRLNQTLSDTWPTTVTNYAVASGLTVADAGSTGTNSIVTVGNYNNGTNFGQIRVYHKASNALVLDSNTLLRSPTPNYYLSGVAVGDIDGNGQNDTVYVANGGPSGAPTTGSQIGIYRFTGSSLVKERSINFTGPVGSSAIETRSVAIWSHNGQRQIVTLGYYRMPGPTDYAQLGIWSWDGSNPISRIQLYNWTTTGPTGSGSEGYTVAMGDVSNNGGIPDIVTVGFTNNSTITQSELRIWGWNGSGSLAPKGTRDWLTTGIGTVATTVTIKDLTGNGQNNIIVGGQDLTYPIWRAELTVWSDWTGTLTQLAGTAWITSPTTSIDVIHVAAGDVDASGSTEIVTAGEADMPIGSNDIYYGTIKIWTYAGSSLTLQKSYQGPINSPISTVAVADLAKTGTQDIIDGGQLNGKGFLEVRDVFFVNTAVNLNLTPSSLTSGQSISISGTLTNATDQTTIGSAPVLLEFAAQSSSIYQILATVTTDSQGRFATSFTPAGPGSYTVRATWNGDDTHMGTSNTASVTVNKAPSIILLSASAFNAKPGDTVTVTGYIYPSTTANLTITYTSPAGSSTSHNVNADNTGYFTDSYTVDVAGTWKVGASWTGNSSNSGASSNSLEIQTQPDPVQFQYATYGFILAIAALAAGLAGIIRSRRPKAPIAPLTVATK